MKKIRIRFVAMAAAVALLWNGVGSVGVASEVDTANPIKIIDAGTPFWNVIGSSEDNKVNGMSWIRLWEYYTEIEKADCAVKDCGRCACVGGHVVFNPNFIKPISANVRDLVYILPLCNEHNAPSGRMVANNTLALKLINYCSRNQRECQRIENNH